LVQNVPEADQTEEVLDVIGMLRMVLMRVDDSLVREWERLQSIERDGLEEDSASVRPPPSLEEDPRAFNARIRAELHALVRALSVRDYDAAVRCVAESPDDPWTDERFENALEEYWSQYDALLFNHRARLADKTIRTEAGPRRWEVTQVLCDPDEDDTWCLELVIELEGRPKDSPKPLLRLIRVGL
jgi:hypothetical protein